MPYKPYPKVLLLFFFFLSPLVNSLTPAPNPITLTTDDNTTFPLDVHLSTTLQNFALITAWTSPLGPPTWFRSTHVTAIQIFASAIIAQYARLPPTTPVGRDYLSFGPESRPNMNYLDTRIVIRQYEAEDWGGAGEPGVPEEGKMTNGDVAEAARVLGTMYGRGGEARKEGAWRMCYLGSGGEGGRERVVERCTGVLMVQRDVWIMR